MLMILSPSKRQRFPERVTDNPSQKKLFGHPEWLAKAEKIAAMMRSCSPHELARILRVSDTIAVMEAGHFDEWNSRAVYPQTRPAVMTFDGDAYRALDAETLAEKGWTYLNRHLRILSALYGVLKPFDLIQPYRVSFGTTAVRPEGRSLYDYWKKPVTGSINRALKASGSRVLVNLASAEFARVIDRKTLDGRMVTPVFQEMGQGEPRVMGLYAKQARGAMTRYAAEHGITDARDLRSFDLDGYAFHAASSKDDVWVFRR